MKEENLFFLDLRFRDRRLSEQILDLLSRNFAVVELQHKDGDLGQEFRLALLGEPRQIDALRRFGKERGFYVSSAARMVA